MTLPVSIGDAYLIGTMALRLGRAFTTGRKSAPAEFREVENQLYSLSAALCAFEDAHAKDGTKISLDPSRLPRISQRHSDGDDIVLSMLRNCEETLKHLEGVVDKYSRIGKTRDQDQPRLKRWSRDLKDNWKKIAWTTEGGDLATLRSQLTVHSNSLNLVLGVLINSQAVKLDDRVEQVATMLKEIHVWFVDNLKDTPSATKPLVTQNGIPDQDGRSSLDNRHFQLYVESDRGSNLICSHAGLDPNWKDNLKHSKPPGVRSPVQNHLFLCQCSRHSSQATPHHTTIAAYGLSPLSFSVRLVGKERAWMLYKATDKTINRLVSLIMRNLSASVMAEFEEMFIHYLSIIRTRELLRRNMNTMLAYVTAGSQDSSEVRVLNLVGDMNKIQRQTEAVTFTSNRQSYTRNSIESIQLLHYISLDIASIISNQEMPRTLLSWLDSSEIIVFYDQQEPAAVNGDINRTILHLKHNTSLIYDPGDTTILLKEIDCTGLGADEQGSLIPGVDVTFQFVTFEAALHFQAKLEEMRMELYVMNLQFPRADERTILKLEARNVHTEEIHISDAEVLIVQNTNTQRLRLIIVSQNGCSILSQELAADFLSPTTSFPVSNSHPKFTSPTYLVQISGTGTREIFKFARGFGYLNFGDVQSCRLFELGLATIAGKSPLVAISEPRGG